MIIKISRGKSQIRPVLELSEKKKKLYQVSKYSHIVLNVQWVVAVDGTVGSNCRVGSKTSEDQGSRNYKKLQKNYKNTM